MLSEESSIGVLTISYVCNICVIIIILCGAINSERACACVCWEYRMSCAFLLIRSQHFVIAFDRSHTANRNFVNFIAPFTYMPYRRTYSWYIPYVWVQNTENNVILYCLSFSYFLFFFLFPNFKLAYMTNLWKTKNDGNDSTRIHILIVQLNRNPSKETTPFLYFGQEYACSGNNGTGRGIENDKWNWNWAGKSAHWSDWNTFLFKIFPLKIYCEPITSEANLFFSNFQWEFISLDFW